MDIDVDTYDNAGNVVGNSEAESMSCVSASIVSAGGTVGERESVSEDSLSVTLSVSLCTMPTLCSCAACVLIQVSVALTARRTGRNSFSKLTGISSASANRACRRSKAVPVLTSLPCTYVEIDS